MGDLFLHLKQLRRDILNSYKEARILHVCFFEIYSI